MKHFITLFVLITFVGIVTYFSFFDNLSTPDKNMSINKTLTRKSEDIKTTLIKDNISNQDHAVLSHKLATQEKKVVRGDMTIKEIKQKVDKQQVALQEKILELDNDLRNKELQNGLKRQLQDASEYRKNILMKAKQEMKKINEK